MAKRNASRRKSKPRALKKAKRVEYAEFTDKEFRRHLRSHSGGKRSRSRKTHGNPVRVGAALAGSSSGWMHAKAVRVRKVKGGHVVEVKR